MKDIEGQLVLFRDKETADQNFEWRRAAKYAKKQEQMPVDFEEVAALKKYLTILRRRLRFTNQRDVQKRCLKEIREVIDQLKKYGQNPAYF